MTRIGLIAAGLLLLSFVVTLLTLTALGDPRRFIALLLGSLLVPGAVFAGGAAIRGRRRPSA